MNKADVVIVNNSLCHVSETVVQALSNVITIRNPDVTSFFHFAVCLRDPFLSARGHAGVVIAFGTGVECIVKP